MTVFLLRGFNHIAQNRGELFVYSSCCEVRVLWRQSSDDRGLSPYCCNCSNLVPTMDPGPVPVIMGIGLSDAHIRNWLSFWTGHAADNLEVNIDGCDGSQ